MAKLSTYQTLHCRPKTIRRQDSPTLEWTTAMNVSYLFEEVVSELLEGEEGGAAVVVDPFVDILQLNDLPDLWRQRLQKNIGKSQYKTF